MNDDNILVLISVEFSYISDCQIEEIACAFLLYSAVFRVFIAWLISIKYVGVLISP